MTYIEETINSSAQVKIQFKFNLDLKLKNLRSKLNLEFLCFHAVRALRSRIVNNCKTAMDKARVIYFLRLWTDRR